MSARCFPPKLKKTNVFFLCFSCSHLSQAFPGLLAGHVASWLPPGCSWVPPGCPLGASWVPSGWCWVPPGCVLLWIFLLHVPLTYSSFKFLPRFLSHIHHPYSSPMFLFHNRDSTVRMFLKMAVWGLTLGSFVKQKF